MAQDVGMTKPAQSGESIYLFTDRTVYAISEKIYFSAYYNAPETGLDQEWSTVMYVELIKWNGIKLLQSKVAIEDNVAMGSLHIPSNLESGNYYLRAYTKWMRNYSQYAYTYTPVKVVNPYTRNIDLGPDTRQTELLEVSPNGKYKENVLQVSEPGSKYGKRDSVVVDIELEDGDFNGRYCVSVARLAKGESEHVSHSFLPPDSTEGSSRIEYLPEINGLSLSGQVLNMISREPVENIKVNLSSYSSSFYYSATNTDQDGFFVFTLPHYNGMHELHVSIENDTSNLNEVLLRSEFCNRPLTLPFIPFMLGSQERSRMEEMIFNAQVCYRFAPHDSVDTREQVATAFYGKPPTVILEEDFIELIDLEEFFYELVYNVSIGHRNRKPYLVVHGETSLVSYPPLLLMDNIPVKNDEKLLAIPCRMIERVEVINSGYIVGDFKYNGIISIFSENRDMAGLEQEENTHFFNFQLFDHKVTGCSANGPADENNTLPDRRNLLYWNPDLKLSANHASSIKFRTPDAPGEYVLTIRGIDPSTGTKVLSQSVFEVE